MVRYNFSDRADFPRKQALLKNCPLLPYFGETFLRMSCIFQYIQIELDFGDKSIK